MTAPQTRYALAQQAGSDVLRRALLDVASQLLTTAGPQALTMRRLAKEAGCSTTVLYTMFGGKDGLADGLYREGFERLRRRLDAIDPDLPPLERLAAAAAAYRENALTESAYYGVMFAQTIPGYTPGAESRSVARASLATLTQIVADGLASGDLADGGADEIAELLWAAAHGTVSLELAGFLAGPGATERFSVLTRAAMTPFITHALPPR